MSLQKKIAGTDSGEETLNVTCQAFSMITINLPLFLSSREQYFSTLRIMSNAL